MSRLIACATVAALFLAGPGDCAQLNISLDILDRQIPACGVVAGDIVLTNTGSSPICLVDGLSLFDRSVAILVTDPEGATRRFGALDLDCVPRPGVAIAIGAAVRFPICIMSTDDGDFVFEREGQYAIVARVRNQSNCTGDGVGTSDRPSYFNLVSEPLNIAVRPVQPGIDTYRAANASVAIWRAFSGYTITRGDLSPNGVYGAYAREQVKLLLYTYRREALVRALQDGAGAHPHVLAHAREMIGLAREHGISVPMWEWIQARLEDPPNAPGAGGDVAATSYCF